MITFSTEEKHTITQCNYNYSSHGILHPHRIMAEYDFLYMIQGSWEIIEDGICYELHENELLILEPGRHHYSKKRCSPNMRNMFLHCLPVTKDGLSTSSSIPIQKLTDCSHSTQIPRLFHTIIESYWNRQDSYKEQRLSNLFELLLYELADLSQTPVVTDPLVQHVLNLFLSNSERFYHLEELAAQYSISAHTLGIRFKKATGTTLYQYQLTQKLSMIHELLPQDSSRSLRDLALSFGFYDEFQLSKLYKRQFGYPPSTRRKSLR